MVRVLITVQKKIFGELDPSSAEVSWAGGNIVQIEVTPMDDIDATALLRKQSRLSEKDLTGDLCCSINKSVGGNPMALLQVAIDLPFVRTFNRGFDELISSLTDPTTSLHNQLDKSINRIPRTDVEYSHIDVLVNLSLFKTAWFSFEQAAQIGVGLNKDSYGTKFNEKHERNTRTILSLLILRGQHLIEIDKQGVGEDISTSRNFILYWYSLHPLIYKHVHQKYVENVSEKDKHKKASLENARLRYMRYFCKEIDKFGEKYGTKPHEAQALLEKTRVHMKNFYEYFLNGTIRIDDVMTDTKGDKEFTTLDCKRYSLWKMLDYVQTAETKINFARRLSSDAERECKLYVYVYWTCKEVEFHLAAGQTIRACSIFTELSNKLGIVSDDVRTLLEQRLPWKLEDVERYPMFGVYFETKARTLKEENSKNKGIVDCLENARKLYNQSIKVTTKKQYQMLRRDDIARVVDSIGNYHFVNGDFNKSKEYHEKALCIVQKDKHGCAINMKELTEFKHPSSSEYLTNIAACEHELGRAAPDSGTKTELLEGAKEKYTFCIEYDKTMKRDFLQSHAQKLMNRAEIYSQLKKLDLAIQDAMKALKIFKQHYSMPNATKTLSYAQLAYFYYKKGRKSSNPAERKEVLKQSINLYDDALCEITHGGLPSDHKEFKDIKDFHMKAMKAAGLTEMDVQQRVNRYSDFILGKYDKKINKIRQTDPGRSLQTELQKLELQGAVGVVVPSVYVDSNTGNIGHDVVSEMVADIRSSTSSSEQEEDDSNEWEGFDDDLDDLIASSTQRKRRDSGVEDDIEIAPESSNGDKPHLDKMEVVPTVSVVKDVGSELGSYIDSGVKQCPDESSTVKSVDMHEAIDTETKPGNLDDAQHRLDDKQIDSDSYTTKIVDDSISQEDTGRDAEIEKMETGQTGSASESVSVMKGKVGANKRSLRRQESVDIESHFDDVPEQRSSMKDVDQSDCVSLDEEQRRKRRRSSIDTGFGDGNRLSTSTIRSSFGSSTNRSSLSSIGSQDSVTSMLGKRLNLQSDLSLHPEDDPNALDKETGD